MLPKTSIINEIEKYRANPNIKIIANTSNLDKILIRVRQRANFISEARVPKNNVCYVRKNTSAKQNEI